MLHSDAARHVIVLLAAVAAVAATYVVTVAVLGPPGVERGNILLICLLAGFGLYGPLYLVLTHFAFRGLRGRTLRARLQQSRARGLLVRMLLQGGGPKTWAIVIATVALVSVTVLLVDDSIRRNPLLISGCVLAIVGTWLLLTSVFAVEYARAWAEDGSFEFPGQQDRTFFDFLYLAFQVSTTFSSSDVQVMDRRGRGMVTAQSIVAFAYSTVIVAVFVSILLSIAG